MYILIQNLYWSTWIFFHFVIRFLIVCIKDDCTVFVDDEKMACDRPMQKIFSTESSLEKHGETNPNQSAGSACIKKCSWLIYHIHVVYNGDIRVTLDIGSMIICTLKVQKTSKIKAPHSALCKTQWVPPGKLPAESNLESADVLRPNFSQTKWAEPCNHWVTHTSGYIESATKKQLQFRSSQP